MTEKFKIRCEIPEVCNDKNGTCISDSESELNLQGKVTCAVALDMLTTIHLINACLWPHFLSTSASAHSSEPTSTAPSALSLSPSGHIGVVTCVAGRQTPSADP